MKKENQNENYNIPAEFCGQGVSVSSKVSIKAEGPAYIKAVVKDGTDEEVGTFVLADDRKSAYLDLRDIDKMKRRTLINVLGKIKDTLEYALSDQLAAEDDGSTTTDEHESPAEDETSAEE